MCLCVRLCSESFNHSIIQSYIELWPTNIPKARAKIKQQQQKKTNKAEMRESSITKYIKISSFCNPSAESTFQILGSISIPSSRLRLPLSYPTMHVIIFWNRARTSSHLSYSKDKHRQYSIKAIGLA